MLLKYFFSISKFVGRRIVDINFIFRQIFQCRHKGGFDCTFMDMQCISERNLGFYSEWDFECKMCSTKFKLCSELQSESEYIAINKAAVSGSIAVGTGYSQLAEFAASIDVPCMTNSTYIKTEAKLTEYIQETSWDEIRLAGLFVVQN